MAATVVSVVIFLCGVLVGRGVKSDRGPSSTDASAPAAPPATPASAGDYAIQVAALREAGEADTIAKRLVSKGYGAYVLTPPDGKPNVFRVRIGSFKTRREAEVVASKLQKEEQ